MLKAQYQDRTGLFPEIKSIAPIKINDVRMTLSAREALEESGAIFSLNGDYYLVELGQKMPKGIVAARVPGEDCIAIRLENEMPYPDEFESSWWEQAEWLPCPVCSAPLVWYEAGYVPGYRVCTSPSHHHVLIRTGSK